MINVTKAYLPDRDKYKAYVDRIFDSGWLTNRGTLVRELESRLQSHLGVRNIIVVANGSLALQLAYRALGLRGRVITTPFSFVATTSTLAWENLKPVFADIDPGSLNIDPAHIEPAITPDTSAIVPVHTFGNPCAVEAIEDIARRHQLRVIYDAAHAFGTRYKGESLLSRGDISTISFHATKLFHTTEGGAVITDDDELAETIRRLINFGITGPTSVQGMGTNAKMNEFEAAMGLCILDDIDDLMEQRQIQWLRYQSELGGRVQFQRFNEHGNNNCAYAPVILESEQQLLGVERTLREQDIIPRRYFYPSLNTLDYLEDAAPCPVSEDIAARILCLPLYPGLSEDEQQRIISTVKSSL